MTRLKRWLVSVRKAHGQVRVQEIELSLPQGNIFFKACILQHGLVFHKLRLVVACLQATRSDCITSMSTVFSLALSFSVQYTGPTARVALQA